MDIKEIYIRKKDVLHVQNNINKDDYARLNTGDIV